MIRKHIKVEPSRWYYHCDQLGILVWQDQPSGFDPAAWPPERAPMQMFPPWTRMEPAPVRTEGRTLTLTVSLEPHPYPYLHLYSYAYPYPYPYPNPYPYP
jgi:hypothetical protein